MLRALLPALFLAACTPSGVYMITVPYSEGAIECDSSLEENFSDAYSPDPEDGGDGPWTYESTYTGADQVLFFHIAPTSGGTAVLTWGNAAYPGAPDGDGWTFEWTQHTDGSETAHHEDDYDYSESYSNDSTVTIHIAQPLFAELNGTVAGTSASVHSWTESDEWDTEDIGVYEGEIPSSSYLVYKDSGDLYPQVNSPEEDDCKSGTCELSISQSCTQLATPFTAKQVNGNDVLLYNDMVDDGQSGGGGSVDTGF